MARSAPRRCGCPAMTDSASVGAVIVSYGPSSRALRCAESLFAGGVVPAHVVIVNNGPDAFQHIDAHEALTVVEAPENLGYSGGLKFGVDIVLSESAEVEYLWLLNNDLAVHAGALSALMDAARREPSVGLWGCTVCADGGFELVAAAGVRYSRWTTGRRPVFSGVRVGPALAMTTTPQIDFIPGSAMFLSRDTYTRCGGLSDTYFLYYEELDLAARVRGLGLDVGWCREALVAHVGGASTGSYRPRGRRPASVAYHSTRSALIYTRRHARSALPSVLACRLGYAGSHAVRGDLASARAALRGCFDGLSTDVNR
jgi:GT2 family glycosyltransferase